jgi:AbrB family looped-hinge helix DNA binding protein
MGIEIRVSSKGQIVIPKEVRDALGLEAGGKLMLERAGRRLILEAPQPDRPRISYEEFRRRVPKYEGPTIPVEEMTRHVGDLFRDWKE